MSWDFATNESLSKDDMVNEILSSYSRYGTILANSVRGNHLWFVYTDTKSNQPCILLALLKKDSGCWGYKIMDETEGPYYYDCPKKFLKLQPVVYNKNAKTWRESVLSKTTVKPNNTMTSNKGFSKKDVLAFQKMCAQLRG